LNRPRKAGSANSGDLNIVTKETPKGLVTVRPVCPPGFFGHMEMESGLGHFAHYSSIIKNVNSFETIARRKGGRVTLAVLEPNLIVGYGLCWYPDETDRWNALGELMYEMAAVEVSRNLRGMHLARTVMDVTMDDDFFEDKITYMMGLSWHWDLEGKGLSAAQYRRLMMELYSLYGFREVYTNEPNIALRPENVMMIRVGSRVSEEDQTKFRYLRFGIKPKN
jgi:acetoin utilization protein AcuA